MDTHIQGPVLGGQNFGSVMSQRIFPIAFNDRSGTEVRLCTIDATEQEPVLVDLDFLVTEVFNAGTTNVLIVGNTVDDDAYYAASDINEAATGFAPSVRLLLTSRTILTRKYTQSGTAANTGAAKLIVRVAGAGKGKEISY